MVNQPKSVNISEDDVSNPVFRIMRAARFCNLANLKKFQYFVWTLNPKY